MPGAAVFAWIIKLFCQRLWCQIWLDCTIKALGKFWSHSSHILFIFLLFLFNWTSFSLLRRTIMEQYRAPTRKSARLRESWFLNSVKRSRESSCVRTTPVVVSLAIRSILGAILVEFQLFRKYSHVTNVTGTSSRTVSCELTEWNIRWKLLPPCRPWRPFGSSSSSERITAWRGPVLAQFSVIWTPGS